MQRLQMVVAFSKDSPPGKWGGYTEVHRISTREKDEPGTQKTEYFFVGPEKKVQMERDVFLLVCEDLFRDAAVKTYSE